MSRLALALVLLITTGSVGLAQSPVVSETDVIYGHTHGSALVADIAYPRDGDSLPAIIYVHGGRWRGGNKNNPSGLQVAQWADFGYFAMTIEYRLVGGSPAPAPYQDVLTAIRWMHAHADEYNVDPDRIYLIGNSSGGHLVALVATLGDGPYEKLGGWEDARSDVRAVISAAGAYDLNTLSWGDLWTPVEGDVEAARRLASPLHQITPASRPILIIHSDDDQSVPVQQAQDMAEALAAGGIHHRFVHYQDRGHMSVTDEVIAETRAFVADIEGGQAVVSASGAFIAGRPAAQEDPAPAEWNAQAAATYLDGRMSWWLTWPTAARDHGTSCVSCHTALPYALSRSALRGVLSESASSDAEDLMLERVVRRVRMWREVEPFYSDQTRGLPKTSESRGTEAVLNAVILSAHDAEAGAMSDDLRLAFSNMWALQMRRAPLEGGWAWLNFGLEPWEGPRSSYFGASLAAIAVGMAPADYAATPEIQDQLGLLREYLRKGADTESLFNRLMILWASRELPGVLEESQRQAIVDAAMALQKANGGWSLASLAPWKRIDGSELGDASDGFATALAVLALQEGGGHAAAAAASRGSDWLVVHQQPDGSVPAVSINKVRDPATDQSRFMSDAATALASLAIARR